MAYRYDDFTAAGARLVAISVDAPQQNAALVEKLGLPFPVLSDPDRSGAIEPYGVADPRDPRKIARPAIFVIAPDRTEVYRHISGDFADRPTEDEILDAIRPLDLPATTPEALLLGPAEPGPRAMPISAMEPYYRGAKFAVIAMRMRHSELSDEAETYIAELDRFITAVRDLKVRKAGVSQ